MYNEDTITVELGEKKRRRQKLFFSRKARDKNKHDEKISKSHDILFFSVTFSFLLFFSLCLSLFLTHNQTFSHTSCFRCGRNVCLLSNAWRIEIGRIYGQCGQMTRLFVQHLRLSTTMKIFPESIKIAKGRFIFCQILNKPREK